MEAAGQPVQPPGGQPPAVEQGNIPQLPLAWILATVAAAAFVLIAFLPDNPEGALSTTKEEYTELRNLTIFLITALLPSDALIRFGRGILFRTIDNPKETAAEAPRATLPQWLAFGAFLLFAVVTVANDNLITHDEYKDIYDVVKYLIAALLPSEAVVRVGRALFLRGSGTVSKELARRI